MKESRRRKPKPSKIVGLFVHVPKSLLIIIVVLAASATFAWADEPRGKEITSLEDIVVTGTKTPHTLKDVPVETIVITREDIEKTNAQNAIDILKNIPGIDASVHDDVFGTYTWQAKMRGLSFNNGYGLMMDKG